MPIESPIELYIGADGEWDLVVQDSRARPVTTYTGAATLAVSVWPGDDQAETFAPTAVWTDATAGRIKLSIAGSDTASLEAGQYEQRLSITAGGLTKSFALPPLSLLSIAGMGTAIRTYCTLRQILRLVPWIETVEGMDARLVANFGQERFEASRWLDRQVMTRARRIIEQQAERHAAVVTVTPVTIVDGYDAGEAYGESIYPDETIQAQLNQIQGYLDADQLMLTYTTSTDDDPPVVTTWPMDGGIVPRIVAYRTVYEILDDQIGKQGDTPYQDLAARYKRRANDLLMTWVAKIDTDADGIANLEFAS